MLALLLALLQDPTPPAPRVFNGRLGQLDVVVPRLASDIAIDGVLDETVWRRAAVLTGFSDYQPLDGRPASDSTEVLVWYSPSAIYFGVRAYELHGPVHATLADRDRIDGDDNVQLLLDTFRDRRHAFVLGANALGVQADGNKSEGSGGSAPGVFPGQTDLSADFVYQSKGHVTAWGYEIEIRVPFKSLPYQAAAVQDWGINIMRRVQHSGYQQTWTPALRASASFLSQSGSLLGLVGLERGLVLDLNPEVTSKTSGAPTLDGRRYRSTTEAGGNLRWGMTPNLTLSGTVKPDFSQVEADVTEIASDVRFALFVPEKRPFFLEGIEQFDTPNRLIYTRRIVQPDGALKLTGKVGRTTVAALSALDDPNTSLIPSADRPVSNLLRLRRDVGAQSTLGFVYTDRLDGRTENHVAGADARIVFGKLYYAQVQGAASLTRQSGRSATGPLWEATLDRTGRSFGFHYVLTGIDPDFVTASGFVPRTGIVHPSINNRFTVYGHSGGAFEKWETRINTEGTWLYRRFFDAKRPLETRLSADQSFTLRGGWSVGFTPALSTFDFDPASYAGYAVERVRGATVDTVPFAISGRRTATGLSASVSTPQFQRFAASASGLVGRDINFFETAPADLERLTLTIDWRPTSQLRVNGRYAHERFRRTAGGVFSVTDIPRLKVEYQLSRPIFLRFVGQYDARDRDALRDPATGGRILLRDGSGLYVATTRQTSNRLRADWLFSYQPNPGTVLFAGYGGSLVEPDAFAFRRLERRDDGLFVKLSYLFRL